MDQRPKKTEAIAAFLTQFTLPDLARLYNHNQEVQVIVARGEGERVQGDYKGRKFLAFTDGNQTWKPIRIPANANTEPTYEDTSIGYDLLAHAEGIGMTGWDWVNRVSRWVAFDFDAITGHSEKHTKKLSDDELEHIKQALDGLDMVTIRRSTGGKGLHIYVFVEPTPTANHNEHAAVARAILSQLSGYAGFDFSAKVDICGGNMWVWHRKMVGTDGLSVLKQGTALGKVPGNWRDYTKVVSGRRAKNLPQFIETQQGANPDIESYFEELTGQRLRVQPDCDHKRVMDWLHDNYPSAVWWDAEHHMLVTHTALLKECHDALTLRGQFDTNAKGDEKGFDHNCFMFPISKGSWAVRRYTVGVSEHSFWEQDGAGWTRCFFNREADLPTAARIHEGIEDPSGGYWFASASQAQSAAILVGVDLSLPNWALGKKARLKIHKTGKLVVELEKDNDSPKLEGWLAEGKKFKKMFNSKKTGPAEPEALKLDESLRHLISESNDDRGWVIRSQKNWITEPFQHVKTYLSGLGHSSATVATILSSNITEAWTLVNQPFKDEYPRDRQWNRDSARLRYRPSVDKDKLKHPTWTRILNHIGIGLNEAVRVNPWCKANGIATGADWLRCWIASLFQEPLEPLPYIFLYGPQDSGKSILHEALSLLMTRGMVRADYALTSKSNFNGELEYGILCVIEETDLKKNVDAYNKIKDWVTSRQLPLHKKSMQPIMIPNTTHWIQCANSHLNCPVFPGDTRITMILVDGMKKEDMIPKKIIIPILESEASDFLAEILSIELPASNDRLNVPCIGTEDKAMAEYANQSALEAFVAEKCYYAPGYKVKFTEFYEKFVEQLEANLVGSWSKIRVGRELPPKYVKARYGANEQYIGNMSFSEVMPESYGDKWISRDGKLVQLNG